MTSKFALVIANTEYQDASFAKLTAPGRDAEEFAQVLRELAMFDDVQVLLNEGEGKTRRSIARFFAERKRDDLLLLYFSGHGVRNEVGQLFLAANDTEISILEASGIPAEFVTYAMNNSRSQRQLLILDCCNSGAFAYGTKSAGAVGKSMGIATAFEGSGFGRVVLTATDATQYAWEGDKVIGDTQKSVFTHFLIEGLKGEADRDSDGRIHVDELYDYTYEQVVRRTPKQTPGKWSYKQQGDIVLRENLQPREVKPAPLPSDLLELLSHPNSSVRRVGIQDLISVLNGKHLGLARGAEEKLREIAENDDSFSFRRTASEALTARGLIVEQPAPIPFEVPKEKQKEEKKIEKPARQFHPPRVDKVREKVPSVLPRWKSISSRLDRRTIKGIGALLAIVLLTIIVILNPRNIFFPDIGSTMVFNKDGMTLLYVPAGEFTMGSENGESDEQPEDQVYLDAYWIDQIEVTNAMYEECVTDGGCTSPSSTSSWTRDNYYGNSEFKDYPVIYVDWDQANAYCSWADRRLPTEAEWEKAARGENAFIYPWGNDAPNNNLLNYNSALGDTTEVSNYPNGASPYGALDMAGNVWEWVSSLYQPYPYDAEDGRENLNSTDARVLRGGTWRDVDSVVRSADRFRGGPTSSFNYVGFRCAVSANRQADITPLVQASTNISSATQTSQPTKTDTPSPSETLIPATPTLGIGSTMISDKDGMTLLYVPAGESMMGSDANLNARPVHKVSLDAFWIDKTEVTNKMYTLCGDAGVCKAPINSRSFTHSSYYGNSNFDNYPVIYVDWDMAKTYCEWVDRRLPTEAEWEKAARGEDQRAYPWGTLDGAKTNFCDKNCANSTNADKSFNDGYEDIAPVGSYKEGASPYGALDMAGNVWEWVADWYGDTYYTNSLAYNPLGPDTGENRVLRGGSWGNSKNNIRSDFRYGLSPSSADNSTGFRCAMSAAP
jgi:formylglycine-generating enzyme required for sulfatase activity/uncharacterized caspase-like protein